MTDTIDEQTMQRLLADEQRRQEIVSGLLAEQPDLHPITAIVMAGDLFSAERMEQSINDGSRDVETAVWMIGSYARLPFALKMVNEGRLSREWLTENLPELWRGSDPDDTDPTYLNLWREAWEANRRQPVIDDAPLPDGETVPVYRGQMPGSGFGIAWTLDPSIAEKFAHGAGVRVPQKGTVYTGSVARRDVLAYLTGRGESEVIVDPEKVRITEVQYHASHEEA